MRKMVQSRHWLIQLILLCLLWQLGTPCFGGPEHRSVGVHQEEKSREEVLGDVAFFCLYVVLTKIGKKLDKGYTCPVYCEVNHKHIYEKKESHIQGTDRIPRPDESEDREQSESNIRPIAGL
jgi:hypothetical protein